ncbi:ABC transporter substrate-binding protein [Gordonia sp. (in: high G+C Gram-positive bacteria)]|uniref:ABC transporter substrate-binding protein n=1 Tax=Gordonia sp. (in: high G+C Gram-positive bacteria) TaxID=84139 RepID=UPI0016AD88A1|nr:ABC transporter substrate-binding protein [Gordonia sp. (in: high G+C Gram-positive bacteria)]NLG46795.1 ABC transporter substrate-binding protein [Gordonia sp. (in: high G+C Gram-positive bacteria)]
MKSTARTLLTMLAGVLALVLTVSACSPPAEEESVGGPIQVNTPQGAVTVNGKPQRIVTLGAQWIDTALAFGVKPVAYLDNIQILTGSPSPWTADQLGDSTALNPENLVAEIAKADPDLILAEGYMPTSQPENFKKIREIAPTIPGVTGKQVDPWQDLVKLMGTLLRDDAKAKEITDSVNGDIAEFKKALPGLAGKTYAMAYMYSADQIQVMADPNDGAAYLFNELGMKIAPKLLAQFQKSKNPRFPISTENIPMLDADVLIVTANTPALKKSLEKLPGYATLRSVENGAVANLSLADISGLNQPTPLAIPYLLDTLKPAFEKATE